MKIELNKPFTADSKVDPFDVRQIKKALNGNARASHMQYNRTTRAWKEPPHPGHDDNCRCWAEPVSDDQILKEELPPPNIEIPKIPGTEIPDRGIPEQGWPGSRKYDPYRPEVKKDVDPYFVMPTNRRDQFIEKFPPTYLSKKKEWDV